LGKSTSLPRETLTPTPLPVRRARGSWRGAECYNRDLLWHRDTDFGAAPLKCSPLPAAGEAPTGYPLGAVAAGGKGSRRRPPSFRPHLPCQPSSRERGTRGNDSRLNAKPLAGFRMSGRYDGNPAGVSRSSRRFRRRPAARAHRDSRSGRRGMAAVCRWCTSRSYSAGCRRTHGCCNTRCSSRNSHRPSCSSPGRSHRSRCNHRHTGREACRPRRRRAYRDCWRSKRARARRDVASRSRSRTLRTCNDWPTPGAHGGRAWWRARQQDQAAVARRAVCLAPSEIASRYRILDDPSSPRLLRHERPIQFCFLNGTSVLDSGHD
jgi:hypothetical protein